ncbi:DMT family transporter [Candidatus Gottesmanbacteria bacterium]|nr:DMT family transporter [Candidatus Gottesmanbacteria bacterium]
MDKAFTGIVFASISVLSYSAITPLLKKAGLNPLSTIIVQIAALWLVILPFFIASKEYEHLLNNKQALFLLIIVGIINAVGYYASIRAYAYLPIWQLNMFFTLSPLIGGVLAYFILGEAMTLRLFIGLTLALTGIYIAFR